MARTILLMALVCAFAGLSVNAQCAPDGTVALGQCEQCGVVPKDQGTECDTDMDACTVQECDGSSSESACKVVGGTECNERPICTSGGTCNAATGVCDYPFNSDDTECTDRMADTCKKFECQQDSTDDSIDCVEVNVDNTTPCTPTAPEPCTDYACVGGSCEGTPRCLDCETCVSNVCEPNCNSPPACEGNGACVAGMGGAADVCEYSFVGVDNTAGCAAAQGMEAPVCQKYQCEQDMDNSGSCKLVDIDNDPNCDSDDACAPKSCVAGECKTDPNDQTTSCEPSFDVDDGVECFCVPDGSGSSSCELCISPCPDTKGDCDVSNRFCAERKSDPGQATCGSVTCSVLCNRACNTVDQVYASSDCNNKGGCSCKGAISQVDKITDFTGPCCQCNVC